MITLRLSRTFSFILFAVLFLPALPPNYAEPLPGKARLNIVFVLDGLRPDSINAEDTPNVFKLRQEGVNYLNGHSVFPTVTRVNTVAMTTGKYPGRNGITGNYLYVREVDARHSFSNNVYKNLMRLDEVTGGRMVLVKTLGEILQANNLKFAAISSTPPGQALLLNPRAPRGVGILINGHIETGKTVAFPANVNAEILSRFGAAPRPKSRTASDDSLIDWDTRVLNEYVIPELKPEVVLHWMSEPDNVQHREGVGSVDARRTLQNNDRNIGLVLKNLDALGLRDQTNIFIVSDHGFSMVADGVNVDRELIEAGLKSAADSDDVVSATNGGSILLHVKDHDPKRIKDIVRFLQSREWCGVLFMASSAPGKTAAGSVEGTFSLELIHLFNPERGPDIVLTFPWTSAKNAFGVPGSNVSVTSSGRTGSLPALRSNHGNMSPWDVHNTFIAWGPDFKRSATVRIPASNVDITPTLLALKGISTDGLDGRVLTEAFNGGPDEEKIPITTQVLTTRTNDGRYEAAIQVTETGSQRYIDKGWRVR